MDDQLLSMLGRSLHGLERNASSLDDLLTPRTPSSGENAGKAPTRGGPKIPLVASMLDVKIGVEDVLSRWVGVLTRAWPDECVDRPGPGISARAAWINERVGLVDESPWGEMCADEIVAQARLVSDLVSPPSASGDPMELEVGGVREIVSWARLLGAKVSTRTVYRWITVGDLPSETAPDGRTLIRLEDVLARARKTSGDQQYPPFGRVS